MSHTSTFTWTKVNYSKLNPTQHEEFNGVSKSSSLAPQHVPKAFRFDKNESAIFVYFKYGDSAISDDVESEDLKEIYIKGSQDASSKGIKFYIGENTNRLLKIEISSEALSAAKEHDYYNVRKSLREVKESHPRWGSFSAAANMFKSYSSSLDKQFSAA